MKTVRKICNFCVVFVFLCGCGVQSRPPQTVEDTSGNYIVLENIKIKSDVNFAEEGLAVFIRVTNSSGTTGSITRYPEDGVVLSLDGDNKHQLSPRIQIPNQEDVNVAVSIIAVPKDISKEGLNILGFAFVEIVTLIVPGGRIGTAVKYFVERASDHTKTALQEGRLVGYSLASASQIARTGFLETNEFILEVDLQSDPSPAATTIIPPTPILTEQEVQPIETSTTQENIISATVRSSGSRLREWPGTEFRILKSYPNNTIVQIIGRNEIGDWVNIIDSAGTEGWMATSLLQIEVPVDSLPVIDISASLPPPSEPIAPTLVPTNTIIEAPTATLSAVDVPSPATQNVLSDLNGTWLGTTSLGGFIRIAIANRQVQLITVAPDGVEGCQMGIDMTIPWNGGVLQTIDIINGSFAFSDSPEPLISINGQFQTEASAQGTMFLREIHGCGENYSFTWEVRRQ